MKNMHHSATEFSLFVGDLPLDCGDDKLQRLFQQKFKSVKRVQIIRNEEGVSRGFGFIRFENRADFQAALTQEMKIGNVTLRLDTAHTKENRYKNRSRFNSFNSTGNNNSNHHHFNSNNHHHHHNQHHNQHHQQQHQHHQHQHQQHQSHQHQQQGHQQHGGNNPNVGSQQAQQPQQQQQQPQPAAPQQQLSPQQQPSQQTQPQQPPTPQQQQPLSHQPSVQPNLSQVTNTSSSSNSGNNNSNNNNTVGGSGSASNTSNANHSSAIQPTTNNNLNTNQQAIGPDLRGYSAATMMDTHVFSTTDQPSMMPPTSVYGPLYPYGPQPTFGYIPPPQPNPVIPISAVPPAPPNQASPSAGVNQQHGHSLTASSTSRYNSGQHHHHQPHHHHQHHGADASGLGTMPGGVQPPQGPPLYYYYPSPVYFDQAGGTAAHPNMYHTQPFHPQFFAMPGPAYIPNAHTLNQHQPQPPTASQSDATVINQQQQPHQQQVNLRTSDIDT